MSKPDSEIDQAFRRELRSRTRRGFAAAAGAFAAGAFGWNQFLNSRRQGRINSVMRLGLELHEKLGRATFRPSSRAAEFSPSLAIDPIVNGTVGTNSVLDPAEWTLKCLGAGGVKKSFTLFQIRELPRVEMTTELRCVEGWSTVVHWSGFLLKDFAAQTGLASRTNRPGDVFSRRRDALEYVGAATPDGDYTVGLDIESALHAQTLLCDTMNGEPLRPGHGAPLRLVLPTKYGYKSLKRLGTLQFTDKRPVDYWAQIGYDWYAGL